MITQTLFLGGSLHGTVVSVEADVYEVLTRPHMEVAMEMGYDAINRLPIQLERYRRTQISVNGFNSDVFVLVLYGL